MKIGFVLPYALPVLTPAAGGRFGGAEVRGVLFARALAERPGFTLTLVVYAPGQPPRQRIGKLDVFVLPEQPGWSGRWSTSAIGRLSRPWRRRRYWRDFNHSALACLLDQADAQVYATFGAHHVTAEVVAYCRSRGRKSVLFLSSDADLAGEYRPGSRQRNLYGELGHVCHFGLANADAIVVQTESQKTLLAQRFRRCGALIPNPIELAVSDAPAPANASLPSGAQERFALWIGKADDVKRPELGLDLARRCPSVPFLMIMNRADPQRFDDCVTRRPDNVRIVEHVDFSTVEDYVRRAAVVVNTSLFEGFPHVFLQAGKFAVPVVSLQVDPDEFLAAGKCGFCAEGNLDAMAEAVVRIWQGAPEAAQYARNIRAYVVAHHDLTVCTAELAKLLEGLTE